jgi:membrane fusion protein (multidrug efflux system)
VGPDNKVLARSVVTGDRIDERWIIEQGLKPGDRVIVEGLQKARPGTEVDPQPYQPPSSEDKPDESASSEEGASSGE